jgi:hypothetical protein
MNTFAAVAREAAENARIATEAANKKRLEDELKFYSDLLTLTYDKAQAYLNVVKLGGYGAYFALLGFSGDALSKPQRISSAILILVSFTSFVLFEVFKSYSMHQEILKVFGIATAQEQRDLETRKREYQDARNRATKRAVAVWCFSFYTSLGTGLLGALVLLGALAYNLVVGVLTRTPMPGDFVAY